MFPNTLVRNLVSVIIPVFNRTGMLERAVESAVGQTYRSIEVIIIDDGSTDSTPDVIQRLRARHPEISHTLRHSNCGPGESRNAGMQVASGEFIQFLDSDDILSPEKLAIQTDALRDHPQCGIAYGKTRLVGEDGKVLCAPYKLSGVPMDSLFPALLVDRWWNTHTPLYRKSLCDQVGRWSRWRLCEDWNFDARCGALGTRLAFCDDYVSDHCQHSGDRLTSGPMSFAKLQAIAQLLPVLYECSLAAGTDESGREMQHFSRWAFSVARLLATYGALNAADECLTLAKLADRKNGRGLEFRIFDAAKSAFGMRMTSRVLNTANRILARRPGVFTLEQSSSMYDHQPEPIHRSRMTANTTPGNTDKDAVE